MKLYDSLSDLGREQEPVRLAAGYFDGVHRGHQAVIRRVIEEARLRGEAAWIMTFDMHPLKLLMPHAAPPLLTSTPHKISLLESAGIQGCVVLRFTRVMAGLEPEKFIAKLVQSVRNLRGLVVGRNWTFGKKGAGTPKLLKKLGAYHGFEVSIVRPVSWQGGLISSTRIRRAVTGGKLDEAAAMLGREFSIAGAVVSGRGIAGRRLGIPTANVNLHNEAVPADGVYAIRAVVGRRRYDGVANIGIRPTFSHFSHRKESGTKLASAKPGRHKILEVHLFGMRADIRGREIEVFFVKKLRAERRFASIVALKEQIGQDIKRAKKIIKNLLYKTDRAFIMPGNEKQIKRKKWKIQPRQK